MYLVAKLLLLEKLAQHYYVNVF